MSLTSDRAARRRVKAGRGLLGEVDWDAAALERRGVRAGGQVERGAANSWNAGEPRSAAGRRVSIRNSASPPPPSQRRPPAMEWAPFPTRESPPAEAGLLRASP